MTAMVKPRDGKPDQKHSEFRVGMPAKMKNRLYPVVLELFSSRDFHQVTMRDICGLSGVSPSTIYQYHASKEKLVFAILDEKISEIAPLVRVHVQGLESTEEIFRKIFWVTMDYYDRNPGVAITAFITVPMRSWMREDAYTRNDAYRIIEELATHGWKRNELDPEVTPEQMLDLYYMYCHRQIHLWYHRGRREALVQTIPRFFRLFWKTVRAAG